MKVGDYKIAFIGFGHMAQVIFKAIDSARLIPRSQIGFIRRDRTKMEANQREFGITAASLETLVEKSQLLILGTRPAQAGGVLEELARIGVGNRMIASVLAGPKISFYQRYLGSHAQILRVMPNLASEIGEGVSLLSFSPSASKEFQSLSHLLFSSMGEVIEIEEKFMDIGTGMSGSGPGFVFRLIDAMAQAGVDQGLGYDQALKMAAQTFLGAAKLILKGGMPKDLVHKIATPKGTTEAGFKVMTDNCLEDSLKAVVEASARRSRELSEF